MTHQDRVIESPDTRLVFLNTAEETGGEVLRFEQFVRANHVAVPAHVHGRQEERFVVLSGEMGVKAAGEERVLGAGQEIVVPREPRTPSGTPLEAARNCTTWSCSGPP